MVSWWHGDFGEFFGEFFLGRILVLGEPLEVQLRHLAQIALEGRDSEPSRVHEVECQAPGGNNLGELFLRIFFVLELRSLTFCLILASWKFKVIIFA